METKELSLYDGINEEEYDYEELLERFNYDSELEDILNELSDGGTTPVSYIDSDGTTYIINRI